jgi:hypothetical protein
MVIRRWEVSLWLLVNERKVESLIMMTFSDDIIIILLLIC